MDIKYICRVITNLYQSIFMFENSNDIIDEIRSGVKTTSNNDLNTLIKYFDELEFVKDDLIEFTIKYYRKSLFPGLRKNDIDPYYIFKIKSYYNNIDYSGLINLIIKNKLFGCLNIVMIGILVNLLRKKENKHYIIFRYYHENWLMDNLDKVDEIIEKIELESQKYLIKHKVYEADDIIKYITQINKNIWVDFNVKNVYLFGSYGKCKQDEHSDIDVLLVLEKNSDSRGVVEGIISTILFNEFKIPNDIISIYEDEPIDSFTRGILKNSIKVF